MAIKFFCLLFFCLFVFNTSACELRPGQYISLSGAVSMMLDELGLYSDKKWEATLELFPVSQKFQGQRLGGGLFLSRKTLSSYKNAVVFVDKSKEIQTILTKEKLKQVVIETRGLNVFNAASVSLDVLRPYLKNCENQIMRVDDYLSQTKKQIKSYRGQNNILMGIGKVSDNRLPEYLMVQDSYMLTLKEFGLVKGLESKLAYVVWSQKEISKLQNPRWIGLIGDSSCQQLQLQRFSDTHYNFCHRALLIPGISQVKILSYILSYGVSSKINWWQYANR